MHGYSALRHHVKEDYPRYGTVLYSTVLQDRCSNTVWPGVKWR
jgi:hypothetical protein